MAASDRKTSVSGGRTPQEIGEFWDSHSLDDSPSVREVEFKVGDAGTERLTVPEKATIR